MADEITRNEVYLSAIAEGSSDVPEPITREEQYLAKIAGADVGIPEKAITRKEQYYKKIVDNGGGGGSATLIEKSISANGVYNASDDSADGYSKATVDVPNSYAAGDEGKVVSNGALVSQSSVTYDSNGTYDTTLKNDVTVNVDSSKWVRPSDWPDISKLDRTGEVLYLTVPATDLDGYIQMQCQGAYAVSYGHIENNSYVSESSSNVSSNAFAGTWFGGNGGYKVVRVKPQSGYHLTKVLIYDKNRAGQLLSGHPCHPARQRILEAYGNLPYVESLNFWRMEHLECVDITNAKPTSLLNAFKECRELRAVRGIDTWDTSNCASLEGCFQNCQNLAEIDVKNLCKSSCTTLANTFNTCTILRRLDLSTWNTTGVTLFTSLFNGCRDLEEIIFPAHFVTSTATTLTSMFANMNSLYAINFSDWNTSNVTSVSSMFSSNYCLEVADFTGLDFSKLTTASSLESMFTQSTTMKITFPATLTIFPQVFKHTTQDFIATFYELHFLSTTPPSLADSGYIAVPTQYSGKKIYVPYSEDHSVLNTYKTATNWSSLKNYIYEEPQS